MCFYHSLIPKSHCVQLPGYKAHITVLRRKNVSVDASQNWDRYCRQFHDVKVPFYYCNEVVGNDNHLWINCYSTKLEAILEEIGDKFRNEYHLPCGDFRRKFHITIGLK